MGFEGHLKKVKGLIEAGRMGEAREELYAAGNAGDYERTVQRYRTLAQHYKDEGKISGALVLLEFIPCMCGDDSLHVHIFNELGGFHLENLCHPLCTRQKAWENYLRALEIQLRSEDLMHTELDRTLNGLALLVPNEFLREALMEFLQASLR